MAEFLPGGAGWAAFRAASARVTEPYVLVRFDLRGNRLVITDVAFHSYDGIGTETLRRTPLGQIEAIANGSTMRTQILKHMNRKERPRPAENLFNLPGPFRKLHEDLVDAWPSAHEVDQLFIGVAATQIREPHAVIKPPNARPYPRTFYEQVAETYSGLAAQGSKGPAVEIAGASGVPVSTVHRWVKEARRLELLPEGQRGKIG